MNLEKYMLTNDITPNDVIDMVKPEFPKFGKVQVSMCKNGNYGVVLSPKATKILNAAHPFKKENRVKGNTLTIRLNDYLYALLASKCEENGHTKQDEVEAAIHTYLKLEARTSEPQELNSKLRRDFKDCRNELCLMCGKYKERYLGACDGCRWKDVT